jgi:hypothetical protein
MIDLQLINWPVTLSLGLIQIGILLFLRSSKNMAFPVAVMAFVIVASVAVLVKLLFPKVDAAAVQLSISALVVISAFLCGRPLRRNAVLLASGAGVVTAALFVVSQLITRLGGYSSIGFGDGQTVISISEGFQAGVYDRPDGIIGLKRGFGLPAYQSLGFEGEFLVGFLPVVFLAALVATYVLLSNLIFNRTLLNVSYASLLVILLSTESVTRHVYLMNTHALLWAVFAVLLAGLLKFVKSEQDKSAWVMVCVALAAGSMLRPDNLLILAPTLVLLTWVARSQPKSHRIGFWVATFVPFAAWATILGFELPVLGPLGFPVFAVFGILVGLGVMWLMDKPWASDKVMQWLAKGVLVGTLVLAFALSPSAWTSIVNMFINLFLGEGLWGATPLFLVLLYVAVILFDRGPVSQQQKWIFALVAGTMGAMILAKFGDGLSQSGTLGGFARIGWGDSLNRMLVYLIPGASALLILRAERVWNRFDAKSKRQVVANQTKKRP